MARPRPVPSSTWPSKDAVRRKAMTVPDGTYGAPDPTDPATVTLWTIRKGEMSAWPRGQRWAPFPPTPPPGLDRDERAEWRDDWYADVYWPWKTAVIEAIISDPDTAAARFAQLVPEDERPAQPAPKPPRRPRKTAEQLRQELEAIALYRAGRTVAEVAVALDLSKATAWRRIRAGEAQQEPLETAQAHISMEAVMRLAAWRLERRDGVSTGETP